MRSTWEGIRTRGLGIAWNKLVWRPSHIPSCGFILSLAIWGKLYTIDHLKRMGHVIPNRCVCKMDDESLDHFFLCCKFWAKVWENTLAKFVLDVTCRTWFDWIEWATTIFKGKDLFSQKGRLALSAMVHTLWKEHNQRIFKNKAKEDKSNRGSNVFY